MKGMPLPFDFQGKGVNFQLLDFDNNFNFRANSSSSWSNSCALSSCIEPTSVLDIERSPSGAISSSTLSSSVGCGGAGGGGGSTDTAEVAAVSGKNDKTPSLKWQQDSTTATSSNTGVDSELLHVPPPLETGTAAAGKCAMDEWESVLSESAVASPSQEQSILRWIMGDVDDPEMGSLNKVLQFGTAPPPPPPTAEYEYNGGFGAVDQGFGNDPVAQLSANFIRNPNSPINNRSNNLQPIITTPFDSAEIKAPIFTPQMLINQHQTQHPQNPSFFMPLSYQTQQEHNVIIPPQPKRHNPGGAAAAMYHLQQRPTIPLARPKPGGGDELPYCPQQQQHQLQQQGIIDQLYKAIELVQMGNPILSQEILARLNHQLSPIGKPFNRAAFYCKEALQSILHNNTIQSTTNSTAPFSLIFKIGAYKSFSEISPLIQFANFTCNQALLEVLEGFDRIHVVDFDIGYGGQWASLMQELALRSEGPPSVIKITAFTSPSTHDQLELSLTRENLIHFASEINLMLEFEVMSIDSLNSTSWGLPFQSSENEAIAVNLPVGSLASYQLSVQSVLRFVKHLCPKIVVSVDRGCDRIDLPFPNHIIHTLQSYTNLLESLDAVNVNMDALQKIERFLLQPGIEKIVMGRFRAPEKTQHWRTLFSSSGFSPITFSNFTESQAECVVKRTPVRGFNVEKRQSSLVLCWQRKELISASAWRC